MPKCRPFDGRSARHRRQLPTLVVSGWRRERWESVHWDKVLCRMNGVFAAVKHHGGETLHNWLGLDMEVAKHGVAFPATNELDGVPIDVGTEKGHGTARTEGAGADVGRKETQFGAAGGCSLS